MKTTAKLYWIKTPHRYETDFAKVTCWKTVDKQYRVEQHVYKLSGMTKSFLALELFGTVALGYRIISRHSTKNAAIRACEDHARK